MEKTQQEEEQFYRKKSQTISGDFKEEANEVEEKYDDNVEFRHKSSTVGGMTPVLLVCVYNKNGTLITHNVYYQLFSKYGKVLRILIFMKAKVWKAFVEMNSVESANLAKQRLNEHEIFEDGSKINVFFSSLETIKFQNDNSGGVDYTLIQKQNARKALNVKSDPYGAPGDVYDTSINRLDQILNQIEVNKIFAEYVHPDFMTENKESPVLYCRGLNSQEITGHYLMTLFMNFGNVLQIVRIPSKFMALVEFENQTFSSQAKDYLNNQYFMGSQLKIFYSNYSSLKSRKQKDEDEEVIFGQEKYFRYKPNNNNLMNISSKLQQYSINPPSSILHISNIKHDVIQDGSLLKFLGEVSPVLDSKVIEKDNTPMCLVQFKDIPSAFLVMVKKQGQILNNKKLHLSFTRSKII